MVTRFVRYDVDPYTSFYVKCIKTNLKVHLINLVGFLTIQEIELNKAQWSSLFESYLFFDSYKNYLQVDIIAADADDLRAWKGWVESRLRQLTLMVTC